MKTIQHIKVGNADYEPTGEELQKIVHEFMATGKTAWPMEIFRIKKNDGLIVTAGCAATEEEKTALCEQVNHALNFDDNGAVIVTRASVRMTRVSHDQRNEDGTEPATR